MFVKCVCHLTSVSGVVSIPTRGTFETSQVLLVGAPGVFSRGSPVCVPPIDWPVSYELKLSSKGRKTGSAQLISAFVFATLIVQFLFFLNPKFQSSSHLL